MATKCTRCPETYAQESEACPRCGKDNPYYLPVESRLQIGDRVMMRFSGGIEEPGTVVDNEKECFGVYSFVEDRERVTSSGLIYHQSHSTWWGHLRRLMDGGSIPNRVQLTVAFYRRIRAAGNAPSLARKGYTTGREPELGGDRRQ